MPGGQAIRLSISVCLIVCHTLGGLSAAQPPSAALRFAIQPLKAEYLPCETILIKAMVTNLGTAPIAVPDPSTRADRVLHQLHRLEGESRVLAFADPELFFPDYRPDAPYRVWIDHTVLLQPQKSVATVNKLFVNIAGDAGFEPGDYVLTARYFSAFEPWTAETKPLVAPEVKLRIRAPEPAETEELREFKRARGDALIRSLGGESMRQFMVKYPKSVYTDLAFSILGDVEWYRKDWKEYALAVRRERQVLVSEPERDISFVSESIAYKELGDIPSALRVLRMSNGPNSRRELKKLLDANPQAAGDQVAQTKNADPIRSPAHSLTPTPHPAESSAITRTALLAVGIAVGLLILFRKHLFHKGRRRGGPA